ncbi:MULTISPECIES: YlxR family protein [unclassified Luteococcus]|uniref:YlxR family protein n=1 Tax=unclassified Luteococcus TaxID=2639923 RepID=UPI00313D4161
MSPQRTCQGCRLVDDQAALLRFVLTDGVVTPDPGRRLPGRGVWVHPDERCQELVLRRGGFARGFRRCVKVPQDLFADPPVRPHGA